MEVNRRYMAEILPILRKTLANQLIFGSFSYKVNNITEPDWQIRIKKFRKNNELIMRLTRQNTYKYRF